MKQLNFLLQKRIPHDMPWLGHVLVGPNTHNRYYYGDDIPQDPYIFLPVWEWDNPLTGMMQAFTQEPDFLKTFATSEQVIQDLRDRKAHCMINIFAEGWVEESLMTPLTDYFKRMHIPLSQIIYSSNCANHQCVYDKLAQEDRICTYFLPQFIKDYAKHYDKSNFYKLDIDKRIEKTFLCFNWHHHKHRVAFFTHAVQAGLFENFYWSFPKTSYKGEFLAAMQYYFPGIADRTVEGLTWQDVVQANSHLPQVLEPNFNRDIQEKGHMAPMLYSTSLVSVVTETFFYREEIHMTEKIFKAITWLHPFVLVATPSSLAYLHSLGFKTFHAFWDESYDQEQDHVLRMNKLMAVLTHIASWDNVKQREFLQLVQPIVEHNAQLLQQLCVQIDTGKNKEYMEFLEKYGQET